MKSRILSGTAALVLLTSVGIAAAQNSPMAPTGSSPGASSTSSQNGALQLSAAQKTAIFQSVTKEKIKSPPPANLQLSVGAQIPASVELYPLPANVAAQIPAAKPYKYTVAQNQVVLVDPTNMKVVDIIKQ